MGAFCHPMRHYCERRLVQVLVVAGIAVCSVLASNSHLTGLASKQHDVVSYLASLPPQEFAQALPPSTMEALLKKASLSHDKTSSIDGGLKRWGIIGETSSQTGAISSSTGAPKPAMSGFLMYGDHRIPAGNDTSNWIATYHVRKGNKQSHSGTSGQVMLCANLSNSAPYEFYSDGTVYQGNTKIGEQAPGDSSQFGGSLKSIPCTTAAQAEVDGSNAEVKNYLEGKIADDTTPIVSQSTEIFTTIFADDAHSPQSSVSTSWLKYYETVMGSVLQLRKQTMTVCKNNTETGFQVSCATKSNIATCGYGADPTISCGSVESATAATNTATSTLNNWLYMVSGGL